MATVIDSLLVRLGFQADPKGLEGFAKMAEDGKKAMLGFAAAVSGAFYGLEQLVKGAAERMGNIQDFSEQVGMSAREVAALGKVATENDSSLESMESAIRTLSNTAGQAASGIGRGAMLFQKYGLHAKDAAGNVKPVTELMGDVADKMKAMKSLQEQQALGARLGFDPATVLLLRQGREEFEKLTNAALSANPFSDSDYVMAEKTDKLFAKASSTVTGLKNRLAVSLMPTVQKLLDKWIAWLKNEGNVRKIQDAVTKVAGAVEFLVKHLDKVIAVVGVFLAHKLGAKVLELGANFAKAAKAAGSLSVAMGGMKAILTGGLAAAIALIAEDLWVFYQGGDSLTGWMLNQWPGAVDGMLATLDALGAALIGIAVGSGPVGVFVGALGGIAIAAKSIKESWNPLMQWFRESLDNLVDRVRLIAKIVTPAVWLLSKATGTTDRIYGKDTWEKQGELDEKALQEQIRAANERMRAKNLGTGAWLPQEQLPANGWNMLADVAPRTQNNNITVNLPPGTTTEHAKAVADSIPGAARNAARIRARNAGAVGL